MKYDHTQHFPRKPYANLMVTIPVNNYVQRQEEFAVCCDTLKSSGSNFCDEHIEILILGFVQYLARIPTLKEYFLHLGKQWVFTIYT